MAMEIRIMDIRDLPATEPTRLGKMNALITYSVDGVIADTLIMPKEDLTEEKIKEAIKKKVEEREKWTKMRFTI